MYQLVPDKATGVSRWAYLDRKQPHTHDVRALAPLQRPDAEPLLLSGGNDGQVVLYSMPRFLKEHPIRQSKSPQLPLLQLASGVAPGCLMQATQRRISLWQLGRAAGGAAGALGDDAAGRDAGGHAWSRRSVAVLVSTPAAANQ
jgi:U3 small nucleolar RNA-associated protein 4